MAPYEVTSKEVDPVRPRNRDKHVAIWTLYAFVSLSLVAASIVVAVLLHSGAFIWPLMLFGSLVIGIVISGAAIPHLRDRSR